MKRLVILSLLMVVAIGASGCGYNRLQGLDEQINASWSEVQNQYQRRYDLIPNLVNTVKGYATHEEETLMAVTNARSRVGSINVTSEMLSDPKQFEEYQKAQVELGGALSRLLVVAEQYPDLKANQNFLDLQSQLEGTENRIAVARGRYIDAVRTYNTAVRQFPSNLTAKMFGLKTKENFSVDNEAVKEVPKVEF